MIRGALAGKNIILTGASRGLGREIALAVWREGANLLLVARSAEALHALRTEMLPTAFDAQHAHILRADLSLPADVDAIVAHACKVWDRVDVLVNNAAIVGPIGKLWENDWSEWQTTLQVNLLSPVALCRACIPWMIEHGGGKIINLAGGGATAPRPHFSAYATSKVAIVRLSETLAREVKDVNIQVNCVSPGALNTEMNSAVMAAGPDKAGVAEYDRAITLAERQISLPSAAADLCAFLAGSTGDAITGKLISAVWDPWPRLGEHLDELKNTDIYTLRRIVPQDRGQNWE